MLGFIFLITWGLNICQISILSGGAIMASLKMMNLTRVQIAFLCALIYLTPKPGKIHPKDELYVQSLKVRPKKFELFLI